MRSVYAACQWSKSYRRPAIGCISSHRSQRWKASKLPIPLTNEITVIDLVKYDGTRHFRLLAGNVSRCIYRMHEARPGRGTEGSNAFLRQRGERQNAH